MSVIVLFACISLCFGDIQPFSLVLVYPRAGFSFDIDVLGSFASNVTVSVTLLYNSSFACSDPSSLAFKDGSSAECMILSSRLLRCESLFPTQASRSSSVCFCLGESCQTESAMFNISLFESSSFEISGPNPFDLMSLRLGTISIFFTISGSGLLGTDRLGVFHGNSSCGISPYQILPPTAFSVQKSSLPNSAVFGNFNSPEFFLDLILCFCRSECENPRNFQVPAGSLVLFGASGLKDTRPLYFGGSETLLVTGRGLMSTDRVILLTAEMGEVCGDKAIAGAVVRPFDGILLPSPTDPDGNWQKFPGLVVGGVGNFQVCWCGRPTGCTDPRHFVVDLGSVTVIGPNGGSILYHVQVGTVFNLTIPGVGIRAGERLSLNWAGEGISSCSGFSEISSGIVRPLHRDDYNSPGNFYSGLVSLGGKYSLCFCSAPEWECESAHAVFVPLGLVIAEGQISADPVVVISGFHFALTLRVSGNFFSEESRIVLFDSTWFCGFGMGGRVVEGAGISVEPASVDLGGSLATWGGLLAGISGNFRICVCWNNCKTENDFSADGGLVRVSGALPGQTWKCVKNSICFVNLSVDSPASVFAFGRGGLMLGNFQDSPCPPSNPLSATFFSAPSVQTSPLSVRDAIATFEFGIPSRGGRYAVCWCAMMSKNSVCSNAGNFAVFAGVLFVEGPTQPDRIFACALGGPCRLVIQGVGLSKGDGLLLVLGSTTCGQSEGVGNSWLDGNFSPISPDSPLSGGYIAKSRSTGFYRGLSNDMVLFELGIPLQTSVSYQLCYCREGTVPCQSSTNAFTEPVGTLVVKGFSNLQRISCAQGLPCIGPVNFVESGRVGLQAIDSESIDLASGPVNLCTSYGNNIPYIFDPVKFGMEVVGNFSSSGFSLPHLPWAGNFSICYCPLITGGVNCISEWLGVFGGIIEVKGSLMSIGVGGSGGVFDKIPLSTSSVVSVGLMLRGSDLKKILCAVRGEPFDGFVSRARVRDCADCLGSLETVGSQGLVPVHIRLSGSEIPSHVNVYCYVDENCNNEFNCGVPPSVRVALAANVQSVAKVGISVISAVVGIPFDLRIDSTNLISVLKIVLVNCLWEKCEEISRSDCAASPIPAGFLNGGPSCSGASVCDPGNFFSNVLTIRGGWSGAICLCDRLNSGGGCELGFWKEMGGINVEGPWYTGVDFGLPRGWGAPGNSSALIATIGGLRVGDGLVIVEGKCGVAGVSGIFKNIQILPGNVTSVRASVSEHAFIDSNFAICWCPAENQPCLTSASFGFQVAIVTIATYRDCIVSDPPIPLTVCSAPCGGGGQRFMRTVLLPPSGGGRGCGDLEFSSPCNTHRCSIAQVFQATTIPAKVDIGRNFQVVLRGLQLETGDKVLLLDKGTNCGSTSTFVHGGALCEEFNVSGNLKSVICGGKGGELRVDVKTALKVCLCDFSEISRSHPQPCSELNHFGVPTGLVVFIGGKASRSTGLFVLAVLGGIFAAVIFVLIVFVIRRRCKRKQVLAFESFAKPIDRLETQDVKIDRFAPFQNPSFSSYPLRTRIPLTASSWSLGGDAQTFHKHRSNVRPMSPRVPGSPRIVQLTDSSWHSGGEMVVGTAEVPNAISKATSQVNSTQVHVLGSPNGSPFWKDGTFSEEDQSRPSSPPSVTLLPPASKSNNLSINRNAQ